MAKKHEETHVVEAASTMVDISELFALGRLNSRKEYGNTDELVDSFLLQGRWLIQEPATAERIDQMNYLVGQPEAGDITDFPAAVLADLQTQYSRALVIAKEKPNDKRMAAVVKAFEWIHVKAGQIVAPTLMVVDANRRMGAYFEAIVRAFENPYDETTNPTGFKLPDRKVPVIVQTYKSIEERLVEQVRINDYGVEGKKEMTFEERFAVAQRLRRLGYEQNDYRKMFGATAGQSIWYWIVLDRGFPEEKIATRLLLPSSGTGKDDNAIVGRKVPYPLELVVRTGCKGAPKTLDQYNKDKFKDDKEKYVTALDKVGLHDWLIQHAGPNAKGRPGTDVKKIMDRKQIDSLWEEHKDERPEGNHLIGMVTEAILNNDKKALARADVISKGVNALLTLHEVGGYPEAEKLLLKIVATPKGDRDTLLKHLLSSASEVEA